MKPPVPAKRLPKALPLADVEAILQAAGDGGTALASRDKALLEVLYGTGARISEAVGLDVDDLDLEVGVVKLAGKGGKQRLVPIGSYAVSALQAYLGGARLDLVRAPGKTRANVAAVFLNSRGGRLSRQSAWLVLGKAAERAGVTVDVSPHTLRHSYRHPPARRGSRCPRRPGAARPRLSDDNADLHPGHRRQAPRGLRHLPPPRPLLLTIRRFWCEIRRLWCDHPQVVV